MTKARVEPDWPALRTEEVRPLLRNYDGYEEPIHILSVSPRPFSAASVVQTRAGRVFVKRHALAVRNREGLLEEHRFLHHLRTRGASVARVLATRDGETAVEIGPWTYEAHEANNEADLYEDALSWTPFLSCIHARSAGEALAKLHLAARDYTAPARLPRPLVASFFIFAADDPTLALKQYLQARPALAGDEETQRHCALAMEYLVPFHEQIKPLLPSLAPLWTHNDLHASNLLWGESGARAHATRIIDFGLADRTTAIFDIAQAIERNIVEWLEIKDDFSPLPVHIDHLHALLDGYESIRPLSDEEAAALAPITALGHAEFALTEADYFLGVLESRENARICTHDYLIGHARWFASAQGQTLLAAIDRWAETRRTRMEAKAK